MKKLLLAFLATVTLGAFTPPAVPTTRVTDEVHVLTPATVTTLNKELSDLEEKNGSQVLVYIAKTTAGVPLEEWTHTAARSWKVGQKKDNNGAVLFVFMADHKIRLEIGTGLEGAIPDIRSSDITENAAAMFKKGDFNGGVLAATNDIVRLAGGEKFSPHHMHKNLPVPVIVIIIGAIVLILLLSIVVSICLGGGGGYSSGGFGGWGGSGGNDGGSSSGGGWSGGGGDFSGGGSSSSW